MSQAFRPRARLLQLLGDQLIGSTLLVSARFTSTVPAADLVVWLDPILRIREQLLMGILVHSATHAIRPGTLRF